MIYYILVAFFVYLVPSLVVVVAKVSKAAVEAASALTLYSALTFHFLFVSFVYYHFESSLFKDSFLKRRSAKGKATTIREIRFT